MSEAFYVVTKASADDSEYIGAVVFNATNDDTDNEAAANEFAESLRTSRGWQSHAVVPAAEFDTETDAVADPGNGTD